MAQPRGFTLIELLVVIAIIGVLASAVFASLGAAREKARDATRIHTAQQFRTALDLYYANNGSYPSSGGVDVCLGLSSTQTCWGGAHGSDSVNAALAPYMPTIPQDPLPTRIYGSYVYRAPVSASCPYNNPSGPYEYYCGAYYIAWKPHDQDAQYPTLQECQSYGGYYAAFDGTGDAPHCVAGGTCRQCGLIVE